MRVGDGRFVIGVTAGMPFSGGKSVLERLMLYGQTNVLAIGWAGPAANGNNGPRFLTSDGVYHNDTNTVAVNSNAM